MNDKIRIKQKNIRHQGFNRLTTYDLLVPSLHEDGGRLDLHREVLESSDSVLVLIYSPLEDGFVFCWQFRAGAYFNEKEPQAFLLEAVAGGIRAGEIPETIAIQEAKEEAGLRIDHLRLIFTGFTSPGIITEKTHIYYAECEEVPLNPYFGGLVEEGEEIKTELIKRERVYRMMDEGRIRDLKTMMALNWFRYQRIERG